jgi:exopolysaccharide production protein ExoQ
MNFISRKMEVSDQTTLVWAKVFSNDHNSPLWLQAIVTGWFFSTYIEFPGVTAIRYLCVLAMLALMAVRSAVVFPTIVKAWPLFMLPAFGLSSILWSPYPSEALKQAVYFILTPLIMVTIVSLMDARRVMRCLMFAGWIAAFMVLKEFQSIQYGGPYPSKNYVALQMNFMMLLSLAAALNKKELVWIRVSAIPFVLMGAVFVYSANSATNLVAGAGGIVGMLALRFLWIDMGRIKYARSLILSAGIVFILVVATVVLAMPEEDFMGDFLQAVGKDSTFSGRKAIWAAGRVIQDQHPITGTGLAGFWQYDNGAAQSINFYDFKPYGTKLSFHNAYMEVRVHLGYVGWALYIATWVWQAQHAIRNWVILKRLGSDRIVAPVGDCLRDELHRVDPLECV